MRGAAPALLATPMQSSMLRTSLGQRLDHMHQPADAVRCWQMNCRFVVGFFERAAREREVSARRRRQGGKSWFCFAEGRRARESMN
jgi:hypothetical protein